MVWRSVDSGSRGKGVGKGVRNRLDRRGHTRLGDELQAGRHFLHGSNVAAPCQCTSPRDPEAAICAPPRRTSPTDLDGGRLHPTPVYKPQGPGWRPSAPCSGSGLSASLWLLLVCTPR